MAARRVPARDPARGLVALLVVQLAAPAPATATGTLLLKIQEVHADFDGRLLFVRGENLVPRTPSP
jgi:hypothetical protein